MRIVENLEEMCALLPEKVSSSATAKYDAERTKVMVEVWIETNTHGTVHAARHGTDAEFLTVLRLVIHASADCLRRAFPDILGNTYLKDEKS